MIQPPLLTPIGTKTQISMAAEFLPVWFSRQEILHWEKEILKLLCLFFFMAFGGLTCGILVICLPFFSPQLYLQMLRNL